MRWDTFLVGFLRALFIVYCVEAGAFLVIVPWREPWLRLADIGPTPIVQQLLLHPLCRSALSGFGLVHLVWAMHDVEELLGALRRRTAS